MTEKIVPKPKTPVRQQTPRPPSPKWVSWMIRALIYSILAASILSLKLGDDVKTILGQAFACCGFGAGMSLVHGYFASFVRRIVPEDNDVDEATVTEDARVRSMIRKFRRRSLRLKRLGVITLFGIFASLIFGAILIFIASFLQYQQAGEEELRATVATRGLAANIADAVFDGLTNTAGYDSLKQELTKSVSRVLDGKQQEIATVLRADAAFQEEKHAAQRSEMLIAVITKVSIALFVLFLVQMLVTLYRYNVRLGAFYDSRADALQLAKDVDACSIAILYPLFRADDLDFSRLPKPAFQEAINLASGRGGEQK